MYLATYMEWPSLSHSDPGCIHPLGNNQFLSNDNPRLKNGCNIFVEKHFQYFIRLFSRLGNLMKMVHYAININETIHKLLTIFSSPQQNFGHESQFVMLHINVCLILAYFLNPPPSVK